MMEVLFGAFIVVVIGAFALPLAERLVTAWVWLYTQPVHPELRRRRRAEMASDLWEQRTADRAADYRPAEIGLRIIARMVRGMWEDLRWAIPSALPFEELSMLNGAAITAMLAPVVPELLYGPGGSHPVGPLPGPLVDTALRVATGFASVLWFLNFRYFRRLRFAAPPITGNGPEAAVARFRQLEDQIMSEVRAGHHTGPLDPIRPSTWVRAIRRRRSRPPGDG